MKMKRGKRAGLVLWLLAALWLLGGCMGQVTEREMLDLSAAPIEAGADVPLEDGEDSYAQRVTLYFLSEDGGMLVPVTREVQIEGGMSRAAAALDALLYGPQKGERGAYWPDLGTVRRDRLLEVSSGVATVDLPARVRTLAQETLFAVRMAIAATLTEFPEISYVNVLIGGREEGFDLGATMPVGTLTRVNDLDAAARYARMDEQRLSSGGVTLLTTMYFPSPDGRLILPQVRSIAYAQVSPIEYLYTLLDEMGRGTQNVPAPMDFIEEMPEIVRTKSGYLAVGLRLSGALHDALEEAKLSLGVYMAMLTDTLMGFVPGVEGLALTIGGKEIAALAAEDTPDGRAIEFEQALATRDDFGGYVGAPATLYAAQDGGLARVQRVLPLGSGAREKLAALMALEDFAALGGGAQDVLAVHMGGEVIAVNLSEALRAALCDLSKEEERAAVYAMVNTLTEGARAERVAFFFEGEQVQTLAGELEMRGTFMRNPGMVVN